MKRAILYCRQSKTFDPDDSLSLETQERLLRDLAASRGWDVAAVYVDADRRGWDESRPALADALAHCERGGIAAFCCLDLSRLARKLRHQEQIVERLAACGVELVSYREPFTTAPLFRQIIGAFAEEGTRQRSAEWRRVLAGRAARGLSHGVVPYGYVRTVKGGPIVPEEIVPTGEQNVRTPEGNVPPAAIVAELFQRYAAGWNIADLATDLTRRGVPAPRGGDWWSTQTVAQILDNPVYAGMVTLNNERTTGQHEPIVVPDLFAAVQARRSGSGRPFRRKPCSSWLEGRIWHACGSKMHLQCAGGHPGEQPRFRCWRLSHRHGPLGYCRLRPSQVPAYRAEPIVRGQLAADLAALLPIADVVAAAKRHARAVAPDAADRRRELEHRAERVAERRHKAEELYLSGVRDRPWFDAQDASCAAELAQIAGELAALPVALLADDLRAVGARIRGLAAEIPIAPNEAMAALLAEVGIVVVGENGVKVLYREAIGRHLRGWDGQTAEGFLNGD